MTNKVVIPITKEMDMLIWCAIQRDDRRGELEQILATIQWHYDKGPTQ